MITFLRTHHPTGLAAALVPILLVAACTSAATPGLATPAAAATPAPAATATGAPSALPTAKPARPTPTARPTPPAGTPVESVPPTEGPAAAGVIETDWGKAWDRVPAGFPLPGDARVAGPSDPTQGPASAIYVTEQTPDAVVALVKAGIGALGFTVEGISTAEDGSVAVTLNGLPDACRAQITVRPLGSLRFITVYYGAGCAKP
jgi:hypothetical protein